MLWMLVSGMSVVLFGLGGAYAYFSSSAAYEEPNYRVQAASESYELRVYDEYLVAETVVDGSFRDSGSAAFRRLAGYIFGGNQAQESMKMTVPVESQPEAGTKMQMTAPVESEVRADGSYVYRFVMEEKYTLETLPKPNDARVTLKSIPARRVAARRFSGSWDEESFKNQEAQLLAALQRDGLSAAGAPQYSRFNGPFTLPLLRRNEVQIAIAD